MPDYRLFRKACNKYKDDLLQNQDLPEKLVRSYKFPINLEVLPAELTLYWREILLLELYRPLTYSGNNFLLHLKNALSHHSTTYENITLIGNYNMILGKNKFFDYFTETFHLKILITEPLWFKSQNLTMSWRELACQIIIKLFSQF